MASILTECVRAHGAMGESVKATLDSECQLILVPTVTDHTVLLVDKYWLQAAILVMSFGETTVRQLLRETSSASFLGADSVIRKDLAHAVTVSTGMKRHGKSFNDSPKCAERHAVFREHLCKSGGAPSWVEPVACPVLSRSCFVWTLSSLWLLILIRECVEACGSLVPM